MTAISTANVSAASLQGITYSGAISDDVLLQYCQGRLSGIDQQIDQQFNNQTAMQSATSSVNDAQALFQQNPSGLSYAQAQQALSSLTNADNALPVGDPQKAKIEQEMSTLKASIDANPNMAGTDKMVIQQKDVQGYSDALGNISKDIGSEAEMQMMTLQSLISQRQTAVQMCTNMISSLDDTQKSIAQKIGS